MKKILSICIFVLFSSISFADDKHSHKHAMMEATAPYPTLDVKLMKDAKDDKKPSTIVMKYMQKYGFKVIQN